MISSCLEEYYKSQEQKIQQNYLLAIQYFDVDGIHELRVEIKRLRAFFHLIGHVNPIFQPKQNLKSIRRLFKTSGSIRDIHVQQELARDKASEFNLELSEFLNFLKERELSARKRFAEESKDFDFKIFKNNWAEMKNILIYISSEYIQFKSDERIKDLIDDLINFRVKQNFEEDDYHAIRILSKETRYTLEIMQKCFPEKSDLQKLNDSLRSLHQALGKWHDYDVGLLLLEDFKQEMSGQSLFSEESFVEYEKFLRVQKEAMLSTFQKRWNGFVKLVLSSQEALC